MFPDEAEPKGHRPLVLCTLGTARASESVWFLRFQLFFSFLDGPYLWLHRKRVEYQGSVFSKAMCLRTLSW